MMINTLAFLAFMAALVWAFKRRRKRAPLDLTALVADFERSCRLGNDKAALQACRGILRALRAKQPMAKQLEPIGMTHAELRRLVLHYISN